MTIARFEDIESWKLARQLTAHIYSASNAGSFRRDFSLRDQIQRASVSIMANIAEGFGRNGKVEFNRFLTIARSSAVELRSHLYVALDLGYVAREQFEDLYQKSQSIENLICGLKRYLRSETASESRT
jgi:four helix bundle protein